MCQYKVARAVSQQLPAKEVETSRAHDWPSRSYAVRSASLNMSPLPPSVWPSGELGHSSSDHLFQITAKPSSATAAGVAG